MRLNILRINIKKVRKETDLLRTVYRRGYETIECKGRE